MKDKIYRLSPIWLKGLLLNAVAFKNYKNRYNSSFNNYLKEYESLWFAERDVVLDYQRKMLMRLLEDCFNYSAYYQRIFNDLGITKDQIELNPYEILKSFPILKKSDRKKWVDDIVSKDPLKIDVDVIYTSGTSGSPTKIYIDNESVERSFALWNRFHRIININRDDKKVRFSGRLIVKPTSSKPPFWMYNFVEKQLFMSSYHLTEKNIPHYIKKLNAFKPKLIDGYPSAIYIIAKFINKNKVSLTFSPKAIATTAETLYDYQRVEIEKAFKSKVYNQYASSEGSPFITECSEGKLHINEDSGVFEFLNHEFETAKPGELARMVVTSFRNMKTPLIRYDIEDTVLLPLVQTPCTCGCKMFYVEKIIGREDDLLWTEEKGYVGRMDTAYKGLEGIEKSQIIQISKNEFVVNNIIDNAYTDSINEKFIKNLKDRLGENVSIKINIVDDIPLGPNGKFDAVKREFEIV